MSKRSQILAAGAALAVVVLFVSSPGVSQDQAAKPPEMEQAMEQWAQLNAKGPEHEEFAKMVGKWNAEMRMWMAPGAEPIVSQGTAEFELMLDGRYVQQTYKCDMMGMPFTGIGIEGYDRITKKYVNIWMDDHSTGIFKSEGFPAGSGTVAYYGKMDDPTTGVYGKTVKSVAKMLSDDKAVFTMYDQHPESGEFKAMEITYTRQK